MRLQLDGTNDIYDLKVFIDDDFDEGQLGIIFIFLVGIGGFVGIISLLMLAFGVVTLDDPVTYGSLRGLGMSVILLAIGMVRIKLVKVEDDESRI